MVLEAQMLFAIKQLNLNNERKKHLATIITNSDVPVHSRASLTTDKNSTRAHKNSKVYESEKVIELLTSKLKNNVHVTPLTRSNYALYIETILKFEGIYYPPKKIKLSPSQKIEKYFQEN